MHNFMTGFAFCASIAALVLSWRAYKRSKQAFNIISNRKTRTVTVDMQDGRVTIIKENIGDVVADAKSK